MKKLPRFILLFLIVYFISNENNFINAADKKCPTGYDFIETPIFEVEPMWIKWKKHLRVIVNDEQVASVTKYCPSYRNDFDVYRGKYLSDDSIILSSTTSFLTVGLKIQFYDCNGKTRYILRETVGDMIQNDFKLEHEFTIQDANSVEIGRYIHIDYLTERREVIEIYDNNDVLISKATPIIHWVVENSWAVEIKQPLSDLGTPELIIAILATRIFETMEERCTRFVALWLPILLIILLLCSAGAAWYLYRKKGDEVNHYINKTKTKMGLNQYSTIK